MIVRIEKRRLRGLVLLEEWIRTSGRIVLARRRLLQGRRISVIVPASARWRNRQAL